MMVTSEAYGDGLAKRLRVAPGPSIITRLRQNAIMAVTEIRRDDPLPATISSGQQVDAYGVMLLLRDKTAHQYWEDGRRILECGLRAGETCLYDMRRERRSYRLDERYHSLAFYLPREALNAIADDVSAPRIGDVNHKPGFGIEDATILRLGSSVLTALSRPDQANRLFVDHVTLAVGIHIAQTYGGMQPVSRIASGRLAPWQERRAKEIISANLGGMPLADVARECRLSASHFQRAFHRTVGMPAHRWLLSRRIELAKEKLRDGRSSLSDVALACGFSDQSHLTRVFNQLVGTSPGAWRKWCSTNSEQEATSSDGQLAV
ncbi:MAG TPA: helix-turn-helix transcriptional regulator [Pseudolabrys sp.]